MDLTLKDLTKQFGTTTAVDRVNLTIPGGKLTGLLGPSGCGKSTMLYMISGLLNATEGQILFGQGRDHPPSGQAEHRPRVSELCALPPHDRI